MPVTNPSLAVQTAIHARLSAELSVLVYDQVKEDASLPYVSIGEDTVNEDGEKDCAGFDVSLTLHIWSEYDGRKQMKEIASEIYAALNDHGLSVSGYTLVSLRFEFSNSFKEEDGTYHGVERYSLKLTE